MTLKSSHDTNISAANILSQNAILNIGGDLNLASSQNTSKSDATSFAISGSRGGNSGANSAGINFSNAQSDRNWVDNQTTIIGTNSVNVNVKNNTDIKGAMIANIVNYGEEGVNQQNWIDGGNLTLNTKTLTYSDIYDSDSARSFGIGASVSQRAATNSTPAQNQTNATINYSMHDKEQTTKATIGNGDLNVGVDVSFDEDGNVVENANNQSANEGDEGGINRNIQQAQIITKDVSVNPISITYTTQNQLQSQNGQNIFENYLDQINPLTSFVRITDGITADVRNIANELNIKPITVEIGQDNQYKTIELKDRSQIAILDYARENKLEFKNAIDENGEYYIEIENTNSSQNNSQNQEQNNQKPTRIYYTQSNAISLEDAKNNPNLIANVISANGIMNNFGDAIRNGFMQTGKFDDKARFTIMFDPTAYPETKFETNQETGQITKIEPGFFTKFGGFAQDTLEVGVNYFGSGIFVTSGQIQDQELIRIKTDQLKLENEQNGTQQFLTLSGHSAGARRNYITLQNSSQNQYLDANGNSVLHIQSYGGPVNDNNLRQVAQSSGAIINEIQNNSGDFVGNVLGGNGGVGQAAWSAVNLVSLFEPKAKPNLNYQEDLQRYNALLEEQRAGVEPPKMFLPINSPHSNYYCQASTCNQTYDATRYQLMNVPRFTINMPQNQIQNNNSRNYNNSNNLFNYNNLFNSSLK
jgi:hypothetical protein